MKKYTKITLISLGLICCTTHGSDKIDDRLLSKQTRIEKTSDGKQNTITVTYSEPTKLIKGEQYYAATDHDLKTAIENLKADSDLNGFSSALSSVKSGDFNVVLSALDGIVEDRKEYIDWVKGHSTESIPYEDQLRYNKNAIDVILQEINVHPKELEGVQYVNLDEVRKSIHNLIEFGKKDPLIRAIVSRMNKAFHVIESLLGSNIIRQKTFNQTTITYSIDPMKKLSAKLEKDKSKFAEGIGISGVDYLKGKDIFISFDVRESNVSGGNQCKGEVCDEVIDKVRYNQQILAELSQNLKNRGEKFSKSYIKAAYHAKKIGLDNMRFSVDYDQSLSVGVEFSPEGQEPIKTNITHKTSGKVRFGISLVPYAVEKGEYLSPLFVVFSKGKGFDVCLRTDTLAKMLIISNETKALITDAAFRMHKASQQFFQKVDSINKESIEKESVQSVQVSSTSSDDKLDNTQINFDDRRAIRTKNK